MINRENMEIENLTTGGGTPFALEITNLALYIYPSGPAICIPKDEIPAFIKKLEELYNMETNH